MKQFYIVEIQQYKNGGYGHIVHFAFDDNADKARLKAEAKYYEVLSAAAASDLPKHAAILFTTEGVPVMNKCYEKPIPIEQPAPEVEEPEEEGGE